MGKSKRVKSVYVNDILQVTKAYCFNNFTPVINKGNYKVIRITKNFIQIDNGVKINNSLFNACLGVNFKIIKPVAYNVVNKSVSKNVINHFISALISLNKAKYILQENEYNSKDIESISKMIYNCVNALKCS